MPVWQNRATFRRLGVWIHWWRRSKVLYSPFGSPVRSGTAQSRVYEPCAHLAHTQQAFWRHPEAPGSPQRHRAGNLQGIIQEFRGALLPRSVAARQNVARGSSVVWGSGGATLYLTDTERCSEAYILDCALTPPGGGRPGGKRPYRPNTPF